jgi:site-specific DNA-methyltransferase (adenine-specific)
MQDLLDKIVCGDCIEVLSKVQEHLADLIFADPPFNIGYKYDKYRDEVAKSDYVGWTEKWMTQCKRVLKLHGSFYIAIGDEHAADVKIIADRLGLVMRNWIIWYYTFGQQTKNKFARAHTHILYFVNDKKHFTFNDHAVRVISDRQKIYCDRRANPDGKMPNDVWDEYPRVCGTFKERIDFPCQMPESLLARIIRVSSNEGDWVLDPFSGSGTTVVAAAKLKRKYTGIELSPEYAEESRSRLERSNNLESDGEQPSEWTEQMDQELKWLYSENKIPAEKLGTDAGLLALFTRKFNNRIGVAQDSISPKEVIRQLTYLHKSGQLSPLCSRNISTEQAGNELFEKRKSRKLSRIRD